VSWLIFCGKILLCLLSIASSAVANFFANYILLQTLKSKMCYYISINYRTTCCYKLSTVKTCVTISYILSCLQELFCKLVEPENTVKTKCCYKLSTVTCVTIYKVHHFSLCRNYSGNW
jgi:hypothetical protein